jgi:ComF family protein
MLATLKSYINDFVHLIYPHNCLGCGNDALETDALLCTQCFYQLPGTDFFTVKNNPVEQTFYGRLTIQQAAAAYYFTKDSLIQHLLIELKYKSNKKAGLFLGKQIGYFLQQSKRFDDIELIVPLPLHPKKEQKRGYNQAMTICEGITSVWNKPVLKDAVIRTAFTETQTKQDRMHRWQNMDGIFAIAQSHLLTGKHILLVDDVITTGATLEACGNEILKIPGTQLSIATAAFTTL